MYFYSQFTMFQEEIIMTNKIEKYLVVFGKESRVQMPKAGTKFSEATKEVKNVIVDAYFGSVGAKRTKEAEEDFREKVKKKSVGTIVKMIIDNVFETMGKVAAETVAVKTDLELTKAIELLVENIKDKVLEQGSMDNLEDETFLFGAMYDVMKAQGICPAEFIIGTHYTEEYKYAKDFDAKHLLQFARFQGFIPDEPLFIFEPTPVNA